MTVKQISQQERMVLRLIPVGASKARPIAEISRLTGISARNIKDIVRTLVVKYEIPVIGARYGNPGYYIPKNEEEQRDGIKPLVAQATREFERVNKLKKGRIENYRRYLESEEYKHE